jgi:hypothetical protein
MNFRAVKDKRRHDRQMQELKSVAPALVCVLAPEHDVTGTRFPNGFLRTVR